MELNEDERVCFTCLYITKAGLGYWCLEQDEYTNPLADSCKRYIPNDRAVAEYRNIMNRMRKKGQK